MMGVTGARRPPALQAARQSLKFQFAILLPRSPAPAQSGRAGAGWADQLALAASRLLPGPVQPSPAINSSFLAAATAPTLSHGLGQGTQIVLSILNNELQRI